jgi:DNA-binding NtrC family response regulator
VSTVLVVQPDAELNDIWRVSLESSGHSIVSCATVTKAVSNVREGGIDVVVIDSVDGEQVAALVAELDKLPDAPSVVMVSSSPDAPEVSARVGAAAFLPKPCSPGDLDAAVSRLGGIPANQMVEDEPTRPMLARGDKPE